MTKDSDKQTKCAFPEKTKRTADGSVKPVPQVFIRAIEPEDLDTLYEIENDMAIWDVGTTNVKYSRYALHNYIASTNNDIYMDRQVRLIIENIDHESVGVIDLTDFDAKNSRAEIGIVIKKSHRNQGYATAAVLKALDYSHRVLHLHQLYAVVAKGNEPSRKLFLAMGFEGTLTLKDWLFDGDKFLDALMLQHVF